MQEAPFSVTMVLWILFLIFDIIGAQVSSTGSNPIITVSTATTTTTTTTTAAAITTATTTATSTTTNDINNNAAVDSDIDTNTSDNNVNNNSTALSPYIQSTSTEAVGSNSTTPSAENALALNRTNFTGTSSSTTEVMPTTQTMSIETNLATHISVQTRISIGAQELRNYTDRYDMLFSGCSGPCLNGGVCRQDVSLNQYRCVCTPDFTGPRCEQEAEPKLNHCYIHTCKNGGICAGTVQDPVCSCLPETRGRHCERRTRAYEIHTQIVMDGIPMEWNTSFTDPNTNAYKNVAKATLTVIGLASLLGDNLPLVGKFLGSELTGFHNGSLWARINVKFDLNDSETYNYSVDSIRAHIVTGGMQLRELESKFGVTPDFGLVNISRFAMSAVDPCTTGNHDCSVNAECKVIAPGAYVCICNSFTIDVSSDKMLPGRRCVYDGLIIFTFVIVGCMICILTFLLCGCRRTIWYRYKRHEPEHLTLVNMPANYDI